MTRERVGFFDLEVAKYHAAQDREEYKDHLRLQHIIWRREAVLRNKSKSRSSITPQVTYPSGLASASPVPLPDQLPRGFVPRGIFRKEIRC